MDKGWGRWHLYIATWPIDPHEGGAYKTQYGFSRQLFQQPRFSVDDGANWSVFEDMTYATNKDKWSLIFSNVTTKPNSVQVCSTTTATCVDRTDMGGGNGNGGGKKRK